MADDAGRRGKATASATQGSAGGTGLHYGHPRMSLADRAKIFMPFDALKGLREALEEQERKSRETWDH